MLGRCEKHAIDQILGAMSNSVSLLPMKSAGTHENDVLHDITFPPKFCHFAVVILSQCINSKIYRSQRRAHIIRYSGKEYIISHWEYPLNLTELANVAKFSSANISKLSW
jgi:hypothetical protein